MVTKSKRQVNGKYSLSKSVEFFFDPNAYPSNFKSFMDKFPDFRVGVTTYHNFFTHEELTEIESKCYETERKFFSSNFKNYHCNLKITSYL